MIRSQTFACPSQYNVSSLEKKCCKPSVQLFVLGLGRLARIAPNSQVINSSGNPSVAMSICIISQARLKICEFMLVKAGKRNLAFSLKGKAYILDGHTS